jgi:hypothetical protein
MQTAALKRLLWKDARALLPLWTALLAVVVTIQVSLWVAAAFEPSLRRVDPGTGLHHDVVSWKSLCLVAGPLAFCFAAAAAGILFAGESEEGTDDWLRVLPIAPRVMATGKLGIAMLSLLAFILTATAAIVASVGWADMLDDDGWRGIGVTIGASAFYGLLAVTTGVFLSVRMKRVVPVVVGSLLLTLPLIGLSGWFASAVLGFRDSHAAAIVFVSLGVLDIWLVLRWSRGESVALPRPRAWLERGSDRLAIGRGFSLAALQRGATAGHPWQRSFRVQLWRELRSVIPFALVWGAIGLFCLLPTVIGKSRVFPVEVVGFVAMFYWLLTPGLCGLLAGNGDQRAGQQLFLGHKGVSASATWLAKQATWLTVAVLLTAAWAGTQHAISVVRHTQSHSNRLQESYVTAVTNSIHAPLTAPSHLDRPEDISLRRGYLVSLLLSLYAVGQVCGFWFRNVVVGGAVLLFLHLPVAFWHYAVVGMDVPLWIGCGPLIVLWLLATWRLLDDWLTGRFAHGLRWRRCAWLLGPCVVAVIVFSVARRTQIPEVEFPQFLAESLQVAPQPPASLANADPVDWDTWTQQLRGYEEFRIRHAGPDGVVRQELPVGTVVPDPEPMDAELKRLADGLRSGTIQALPISAWTNGSSYRHLAGYVRTRRFVLRDPQQAAHVRRLHLDGLCILRVAAGQHPGALQPALEARQRVFASLAEWVRDEQRSAKELRQLLTDPDFQREAGLEWWSSPEKIAHAHAETVLQMMERRGPDYAGLVELAEQPGNEYGLRCWQLYHFWSWINGDHARTRRLLRVLTQNATAIAHWDRTAEADAYLNSVTRAEIERWVVTTRPYELIRPNDYIDDPIQHLQEDVLPGQLDVACQKGLRIVIALEVYRREQGEYPASLSQLVPEILPQLPIDPFTGDDFEYLPAGLNAAWMLDPRDLAAARQWRRAYLLYVQTMRSLPDGNLASIVDVTRGISMKHQLAVIPAGQSLVLSGGPRGGGYRFQPATGHLLPGDDVDAAEQQGTLPSGIYREVVSGHIDGGVGSDDRWPLSVAADRAVEGAPPAFVVLGVGFAPWGIDPINTPASMLPQRR